jgi:hypothetical protein
MRENITADRDRTLDDRAVPPSLAGAKNELEKQQLQKIE